MHHWLRWYRSLRTILMHPTRLSLRSIQTLLMHLTSRLPRMILTIRWIRTLR